MTLDDSDRLKVLEELESGDLDFSQALSALQGAAGVDGEQAPSPSTTRRWHLWWLIPFYFGSVSAALGIVFAFQDGWWWLLAAPLILIGILLAVLALASTRSPWLHVRVYNPERAWPKTIGISVPVPFRFAAWVIRTFGVFIPDLDEHAVAELLLAFELGRIADQPLNMELNDPDSATRVEIYLG